MTQLQLQRRDWAVLVLPGLLVYLSIVIFPVIFSFGVSFLEWNGIEAPTFVGVRHYQAIFSDPVFRLGLRNNVLIVLVSLLGQIPIGFIIAYMLYRTMVRGGSYFQAMIFLPVVISPVVVAILWNQIFSPAGLVTGLIRNLTENPRFVFQIFENRQLAIVPVLFVILWYYTGVYMVIFVASMQKITPSVIEAAIIDGARESQILLRVVLPSMVTVLFTTAVFAVAGSLKSFDLVFAMTNGGPSHYTEVIAIFMYINTFKYYKYGYGSAVTVIIVGISCLLILGLRFISRFFEKKYE